MKIEFTAEELKGFLGDALITALEGGSNYWYMLSESADKKLEKYLKQNKGLCPSECLAAGIMQGASFEIEDIETGETLGSISKASCKRAVQLMLDNGAFGNVSNLVQGEYDGTDADIFFQFAVMGKLVYG